MEGSGCDDTRPIAAEFKTLTAWNNEKGAEWVLVGAVQFSGFFLVHNKIAAIEMKLVTKSVSYSETRGAVLKNCTLISGPINDGILSGSRTKYAIILLYGRGLLIKDLTFVNFVGSSVVFRVTNVQGTTENNNGGFTYRTIDLTFLNSPNLIYWRWKHEAVFHDLDGSLTGITNGKAVPTMGILPDAPLCSHNVTSMTINPDVPGSICGASVRFARFSFNNPTPDSLSFKNVIFKNQHGTTLSVWKKKRLTHKKGWHALLVMGETYEMTFENAGHITNFSYEGVIYNLAVRFFWGMHFALIYIMQTGLIIVIANYFMEWKQTAFV